jgi:hypothetical protein
VKDAKPGGEESPDEKGAGIDPLVEEKRNNNRCRIAPLCGDQIARIPGEFAIR